ncbi:hypothetical protein BSL78_02559 [Apostichopus japonicus]|uniref:Uncharacterized protein n=1 Tax=Stichopus japonicus TaxID=307972 RepID=A0A2G8LJZ1_STIJA|nr:hypothetical protein BSL78_02559 [Apostichopus japonicus]
MDGGRMVWEDGGRNDLCIGLVSPSLPSLLLLYDFYFLGSQGLDDCVPHHQAVGNLKEVVKYFITTGHHEDAMLVSQTACEGNLSMEAWLNRSVESKYQRNQNGLGLPKQEHVKLLHYASQKLADRFFLDGSPVLAACCHLSVGEVKKALSKLIRGNELELAICIGQSIDPQQVQNLITMATEFLARRCEKLGKWDLSVELLQTLPDSKEYLIQTCARCSGSVAEINHMHKKAGLPTVEECLVRAESLQGVNIEESVQYFLLSSTPEVALQVGLPLIISKLEDGNWKLDELLSLVKLMSCIRTDKLMQQSCSKSRRELIALSAYIGALLAIRRGYATVVPALYNLAKSPENVPIDPPTLRQVALYESILQRVGTETCDLEPGVDVATGSHLPCHSDIHQSLFSKKRIQGPAYFLEDASSVVSYNDALMWAKVNLFSPLATGVLINPF